jgi:hypothetical protein
MSMLTLRLGIERILTEKVEGVTRVISIKPDDFDYPELQPVEDAASS